MQILKLVLVRAPSSVFFQTNTPHWHVIQHSKNCSHFKCKSVYWSGYYMSEKRLKTRTSMHPLVTWIKSNVNMNKLSKYRLRQIVYTKSLVNLILKNIKNINVGMNTFTNIWLLTGNTIYFTCFWQSGKRFSNSRYFHPFRFIQSYEDWRRHTISQESAQIHRKHSKRTSKNNFKIEKRNELINLRQKFLEY